MADLEKLANDIIEYMSDKDWYNICDNYGNIAIDSEAKDRLFTEVYETLQNKPQDIIKSLKEDKEELTFEKDYKKDVEYKNLVNLIKRVERGSKTSISQKIEQAKATSKEQTKNNQKSKNKDIIL